MALLKQLTQRERVFLFPGITITVLSVTISKGGGAFAAISGAGLANITGNFYSVALDGTDTDTMGDLAYKFEDSVLGVIAPADGTVDQVVTDLPGQTVTNVGGNVQGNVEGNIEGTVATVTTVGTVTGDIGGNVVGNVGGNLVGDVQGNLVGNVGGDVEDTIQGDVVAFPVRAGEALPNFTFLMTNATTHAPMAGLTVTATRRIDGGAFEACANAVSAVASGYYTIDLADTDLAGKVITVRFTAAGADDLGLTFITSFVQ